MVLKKILLILFLILNMAYANCQDCGDVSIDFDPRSFEIGTSLHGGATIQEITRQVKERSDSDIARLWMVAGWIFKYMNFDLEKFLHGGPTADIEYIMNHKAGICSEYSKLFSEFCNELDIQNFIIEGYAPEISGNTTFIETNHAWNVVLVEDCWYHCDLQGFSGKLMISQEGSLSFTKQYDVFSFLARDDYFLSNHIPADPMWQFKANPQSIETLLSAIHIIQHEVPKFNYCDSIKDFLSLSELDKSIKLAANAHNYNPNNHNIMVVNYYNAAIDLINTNDSNRASLGKAKDYLLIANKHVNYAANGVQSLKATIEEALFYLEQNGL